MIVHRREQSMKGVSQMGAAVLAEALRNQPLTPGKLALAWQLAAGPQLARAAQAELGAGGRIRLRARDARWRQELRRSESVLRSRLAALLNMQELELDVV
jgi:hypothetical protein